MFAVYIILVTHLGQVFRRSRLGGCARRTGWAAGRIARLRRSRDLELPYFNVGECSDSRSQLATISSMISESTSESLHNVSIGEISVLSVALISLQIDPSRFFQ